MDNKYAQSLLASAAELDRETSYNGKITTCVHNIVINESEVATRELCNIITLLSNKDNKKILGLSVTLTSCLIKYFGHKRILEICSNKKTNTLDAIKPNVDEIELTLPELLDDLNNLVGLKNVKSKVNDLIAFQRIQQLRKDNGLSMTNSTLHLAFVGNPGTGKTTVARIIGRIYKQIGLLSKGHFIEVSRTDLIAGYQGQTALKVKDVIEKARGGVLFIDEAYSLTENNNTDSYGKECLTELTKALEDYRNDLVVIVAGYTEPMEVFFNSNPGLKSRFNTFISFDDYNEDELLKILVLMCSKSDYILSIDALEEIKKILVNSINNKDMQFANGRFIRNLYDDLIMNHSRRVYKLSHPSIIDLKEIIVEDVKNLIGV